MKIVTAILVALALAATAGTAAAQMEEGTANFYGDTFQGKKTAISTSRTPIRSIAPHWRPAPSRCENPATSRTAIATRA